MDTNHSITLTDITDNLGYGIIFVNDDGTIGEYSKVAQEKFGLLVPKGKSHLPGRIEKGDIVIIADNIIGNDDALTAGDLKLIGIDDPDIKQGDCILAIGSYKDSRHQPIYKHYSEYYPESVLLLHDTYRGYDISACINIEKRIMSISVNGNDYQMAYLENIGFMVIVRPDTGEVKFFQGIGYSFRREEIGSILHGKPYNGKNCPSQDDQTLSIIGMPLWRIALGDKFLQAVEELLKSPNNTKIEGSFEIYRRLVFCKLIRIKKHCPCDGVLIIIQDQDSIKKSIETGAEYIAELERRNKAAHLKLDAYREEHFEKFLGRSQKMQIIKHLAYKASKTKFNVLLLGESGTGKSRLAREIHNLRDPDSPFVEVICNSIAPSLFDYRINVFPITLPPLRERKQDIADMANSILAEFCDRYGMEQKHFSDEALKAFTLYDWPGNVRELENVIERAITVCEGTTIYTDHLVIGKPVKKDRTLRRQLEEEEARILEDTLIANGGDKLKAMEDLGLSRSVFYKKLKEYDLI